MENLFQKPGIGEIAKVGEGVYSAPYEPPAARANVLTYIRSWPTAIKHNPS